MNPHYLTLLILLAACLLYWWGFAASSLLLLSGGGCLELWFWSRVFVIGQDRNDDQAGR